MNQKTKLKEIFTWTLNSQMKTNKLFKHNPLTSLTTINFSKSKPRQILKKFKYWITIIWKNYLKSVLRESTKSSSILMLKKRVKFKFSSKELTSIWHFSKENANFHNLSLLTKISMNKRTSIRPTILQAKFLSETLLKFSWFFSYSHFFQHFFISQKTYKKEVIVILNGG